MIAPFRATLKASARVELLAGAGKQRDTRVENVLLGVEM
jgi:hypothetical protein